MAQPRAMVTLTGLPKLWSSALGVLQGLRRRLRHRQFNGEWAFHLEPNLMSDGAHAHIWWRGTSLPIDVLQDLVVRSGAGREVDITPAFAPPGRRVPALDYGLKSVLVGRPPTADQLWPAASAYLTLNAGGLVHATHGFWTDWNGVPVSGAVERARTIAHRWSGERPVNNFLELWHAASWPAKRTHVAA